jgi:hypothetical protein
MIQKIFGGYLGLAKDAVQGTDGELSVERNSAAQGAAMRVFPEYRVASTLTD